MPGMRWVVLGGGVDAARAVGAARAGWCAVQVVGGRARTVPVAVRSGCTHGRISPKWRGRDTPPAYWWMTRVSPGCGSGGVATPEAERCGRD